jgi:prolyl-tRNA synthetase
MGGSGAHEFMVLNEFGEDTLVLCDQCGYAENQQIAEVRKPDPEPEDALPMEDVETPDATTIDALATFLGIPQSRTAKAAFFVTGDGRFVVAIVRGDYDVNETKLVNAIKATGGLRPPRSRRSRPRACRPATARRIGRRDSVVVVDELVMRSPNLVAGANRVGWHVQERQRPARLHAGRRRRDHERPRGRRVHHAAVAGEASQGHRGRQHLQARHRLHRSRSGRVPRRGRRAPPVVMGSYGIGSGATSPASSRPTTTRRASSGRPRSRPYAAPPRATRRREGAARRESPSGCTSRRGRRYWRTILYDDRDESPGVKFKDAELLGMPWILTVSPRSLAAGGVEVTQRATGERSTRSIEEVEGAAPARLTITRRGHAPLQLVDVLGHLVGERLAGPRTAAQSLSVRAVQ